MTVPAHLSESLGTRYTPRNGSVAEWFKALVLKTSVGGTPPWVRIPPLPPIMQNKNFKTTRYRFGIRYLPAIWAALRCSNNLAKQCATWSCAQSHDSKLSLWPGQPWCPWCKSQLQEFENCNFQVLREARLSEGFQGKMAERQGFEPWVGANRQRFSRPPHSTTLPPLRGRDRGGDLAGSWRACNPNCGDFFHAGFCRSWQAGVGDQMR